MTKARQSALVCGTVRDGGRRLRATVKKLEKTLGQKFELSFFVVESDSTDSTRDVLRKLAKVKSNFDFVSLGNLRETIPNRLERLAHCRNVYLDYFEKTHKVNDFLVVADMDGVNLGLSKSSLRFLDQDDLAWGGATANQSGPYYDLGALRVEGWVDSDPFRDLSKLIERGLSATLAHKIAVESKMLRIPPDHPPITVRSAHGGIAIYKGEAVRGCRYDSGPDNEVEIVNFNYQVQERSGLKIVIIPSFINSKFTEHTSHLSTFGKLYYRVTHNVRAIFKHLIPLAVQERLASLERRWLA